MGKVAYLGASHQFPLPDPSSRPSADMVDTFAEFANRRQCKVSALDIHRPFEPLCQTKHDLLQAMSGGGRIGFDAPYMPRDCDMRWYDRTEICQIVGRFDKILFVGDSMMRHIVGALHILLREDLGYGAVTAWNFRQDERDGCFCDGQFDTLRCGVQGIFNSDDVAKFDVDSLKCDAKSINVQNHVMPNYPPTAAELANLGDVFAAPAVDREKPVAVVYGHGHHNDLDTQATAGWLTSIQRTIAERMSKAVRRAQLFVTPGAAGPSMYDLDVLKHGHKALALFETGMADVCRGKEIDLLGTYNATAQTTIRDGKHSDIRGNLLKIMMVLNWLDKVDPVDGRARLEPGLAGAAPVPVVVPPPVSINRPPSTPESAAAAKKPAAPKPAASKPVSPAVEKIQKPPVKEPKLPEHVAAAAVAASKTNKKTPPKEATAGVDDNAGRTKQKSGKKSLSKVVPHEDEDLAGAPGPDKAPSAPDLPRRRKHDQSGDHVQ
ncbi:hypothetical protein V1517DRAFT_258147 [Lipomyces orientalis]|uniref:Uncharacterized protein n=1 Tax=Lipomyces orientalis TaxID=1233043 RepID=A0ACC3TQF5_9ASCO